VARHHCSQKHADQLCPPICLYCVYRKKFTCTIYPAIHKHESWWNMVLPGSFTACSECIFIYFPLNINPYFHVHFPRYMYQRNSYVTSTHHRCMFKCLWYRGFKSSSITKRCSYCMLYSWIIFNLIWKESYLSYTTIMTFHFCFSSCFFFF